jgi:hypothetical protein
MIDLVQIAVGEEAGDDGFEIGRGLVSGTPEVERIGVIVDEEIG